ncbi:FAD-dependent oxidoreductase, partial [Streptomyces wuyuanensis]|uniref:FAD-dependent oxidoreductase n=1 Tax=Streptomyces wuyuanensis TaxID=1196353 RepID=UPI003722A51F
MEQTVATQPRITVIGAGFAGLTAAIAAAESGARVTLHESHRTPGGRARTAEGPHRQPWVLVVVATPQLKGCDGLRDPRRPQAAGAEEA